MKRTIDNLPQTTQPSRTRIERALADLGECWMYGREFRETYRIPETTLTKHRDHFSEHCLQFGAALIWSGSTETIRILKERLDAQTNS